MMAQPSYAIQYLGSFVIKKEEIHTTAQILASYPTATVIKIAKITSQNPKEGVNVAINGTPAFTTYLGEESYIETGTSYVFDKDCILAVGIYKVVV